LALDYSNDLAAALGSFAGEFTAEQQAALRRVDDLLSAMSGPDHGALWTDDAVCTHPQWAEVRLQARRALTALDWEDQDMRTANNKGCIAAERSGASNYSIG
jgi:hypothetical protein